MTDLENKAGGVLEKRNVAFRVIYDTVMAVEAATDDQVYDIICKNIVDICKAESVAFASYINETKELKLRAVAFANQQIIHSNEKAIILSDDEVEQLTCSQVDLWKYNGEHRFDVFVNSSVFCTAVEQTEYYRLSFVVHDQLSAVAIVQMPKETPLELADLVSVYVNMASMILARIDASNQMKKHERYLQVMMDSIGTGVVIVDTKLHTIIDCNLWALNLLGYEKDELVGKPCYGYFCSSDESHPGQCPVDFNNNEFGSTEKQLLRSDGVSITVIETLKPIIRDDKKLLVVSFMDIERVKEAEKAMAQAYTDMKKVHDEMKDMQSQMVQSEKMASIGELAAGVAHEMNTPVGFVASNFQTLENYVTKIKSFLQTYNQLLELISITSSKNLLEKLDEISQIKNDLQIDFVLEDIQELFDDSREGLERVTKIVQNLRDFSRIDQSEEYAEYDLNDGIKATLIVAKNATKYCCEVTTNLAKIPLIECDSSRLNQVFLNIIVNASQAINGPDEKGSGNILISTFAEDDFVVCTIADDGIGMPAEVASKVFNPFFTTKPVGKGTGLGLSVSYDIIVTKHGGQLFVDSEQGKGTTFTIKLPVHHKVSKKLEEDGFVESAAV